VKILEPYKPEHPIYPLGKRELNALLQQHTLSRVNEIIHTRNKRVKLMEADPLRYGHRLKPWLEAEKLLRDYDELLINGGNRSGKTEFCTWYCVDSMINGPRWLPDVRRERQANNLIVGFLHSTNQSSILQQQSNVYRYLPPEMRDLGKPKGDKETNISYSRKNGFSENVFILPNGSLGVFLNYSQDVKVLEGYEFDLVWCDELVPRDFVEALRFRLATRSGKLLVSFTPVQGYTPTVRLYVAGATIMKTEQADKQLFPDIVDKKTGALPQLAAGCKPGHMPVTMECRGGKSAVQFFWSCHNPFNPYQNIVNLCAGKPSDEVKMRAYGYASKMDAGAFPKYAAPHRISRAEFEAIAKRGGMRYCVCDPGGTKNWFIKWYLITPEDWVIVYREWPDYQRFGEWAVQGDKIDYKPGPAQRSGSGRGVTAYKQLILEAEGWVWDEERRQWDGRLAEKIEERIIDPRFGGMGAPGQDEGTSIIAMMEDEDRDDSGAVVGPRMFWHPARGNGAKAGMRPTEIGVQMINERMDYNHEQPVSAINCPRWYVVDDLLQSDLAYREFSGLGTDKDALKDIVDPDRYLVGSDVGYIEDKNFQCFGQGAY